ncbi:MAG TPA: DUF6377 domain-containing protein [Paludibacter sp.]|nr:DUF6377 domain-containing protein [Paludibacter sp.]
MKKLLTFCLLSVISFSVFAQHNYDSLLNVLDKTIDNYQIYSNQKEARLLKMKRQLQTNAPDVRKFEICAQLYDEYKFYQYDSAMVYANNTYQYAERLNDRYYLAIARMKQADIMGLNGMFREAMDFLKQVDIRGYDDLKATYFQVYRSVYFSNGNYLLSEAEKSRFMKQADAYTDSTLTVELPNDSRSVLIKSEKLREIKKDNEALKLLQDYYYNNQTDIHTRGIFAYYIASAYFTKKNQELEKYWLTVSAIYDLQSATKEYISLRNLALILYKNGDADRAYKYIKRALDDALFCNARQRTYTISEVMPVIDKAYQGQIAARQKQLVISLASISLLTLFLLIAIAFVYKQMRKLSVARKKLSQANEQLKSANKILLETNLIKEEYIGRYMDQCSVYIDKMDNYRRLLNKTASSGKMEDLLKTIKSKQFIEDELKEFYHNFDATFLQLFPNFVKDFAELLVDDEYIQLKPGQLLNTELRIYALMRLGIDDGVKISHFLRCSSSTIYNYRTKIRSKAINHRDEFEAKVLLIGSSN